MYDPGNRKIFVNCDIVFDENKLGMIHIKLTEIPKDLVFPSSLDSLSSSSPSDPSAVEPNSSENVLSQTPHDVATGSVHSSNSSLERP